MTNEIIIAGRKIGIGLKPYIIAEMSANHNGSLDRGFQIIDAAANAGADAIKLQTYTADDLTINHHGGMFDIADENSLWKGRNLYDLYKEAQTPAEWHKPLFEHAIKKNIACFTSVFSEDGVDFLELLNVPAYKIASFENNFHGLLKKVAKTGKPVIMSTGLISKEDLLESVDVLKTAGCKSLILLKCTSTYPADPSLSNVQTIPDMQHIFDCPIGLSDHTPGIGTSIAAVALGACVIEKHFTLNRKDGGVDSAFSINPDELKLLVRESEQAFLSLGKISYEISPAEKKSIRFKRSVYVVKNIKKGEIFSKKNIRVIRPGDGLAPKYFDDIIGKKAKSDIPFGTPLNRELIS